MSQKSMDLYFLSCYANIICIVKQMFLKRLTFCEVGAAVAPVRACAVLNVIRRRRCALSTFVVHLSVNVDDADTVFHGESRVEKVLDLEKLKYLV